MGKAPLLNAAAQNGVNSSEQVRFGREGPEKEQCSDVGDEADTRCGHAGLGLRTRVSRSTQVSKQLPGTTAVCVMRQNPRLCDCR